MSRDAIDDRTLVERMLAGDERAMEDFGDRFFPGLYRYALRVLQGDGELARDLVQTTVVKALDKLEGYRGEAPLFTWLCSCCRNEIGMYLRRTKRFPAVELDERRLAPEAPRAEAQDESLERKELAGQVHATLDELPKHYALALEWKYVESLSVREIARRLGVGPKAAESLLTRARVAFRESYDQRTVAVGGALSA